MANKWRLIADKEGVYRFLIELVGTRYAPVLALVLDPAFDDPIPFLTSLPSPISQQSKALD